MVVISGSRIIDTAAEERSSSPELREFHDKLFGEAEGGAGEIYGSPDDWSPVKASGHYRRMRVLSEFDLGPLDGKTAVDFGTGPWGFACVFPKLREAGRCIGLDVSLAALKLAAERDEDIAHKTTYMTSEGDWIPLDDDSVDIFWGGEVIEHVREPQLFLQEISRICRDGADVFLSTPNRNAIYYLEEGDDYTIGAEHLAVMSYEEFDAVLKMYFDDYQIIGYETSLSPEIDARLRNPQVLELVQDRAARHPQSASGFIARAKVNKKRFEESRRKFVLDEFVWNDARVAGRGAAEQLALFGDVTGGSVHTETPLSFDVTGNKIILLFWAHSWSGDAIVQIDGDMRPCCFFSKNGGFKRVEFFFSEVKERHIVVRRVGTKPENSDSDQVIFFKCMAYTINS